MIDFAPLLAQLSDDSYELSKEERYIYRTDTSKFEGNPDLVLHIKSGTELSLAVKFASENKIPLIPRGTGTGKNGGAVAFKGGIILNFEMMNKIIKIDPLAKIAYVEPGVTPFKLQQEAEKYDLTFPPDPASFKISTLGGNLAENSGGMHSIKYGVTSRYVKGFKYIDGEGVVHNCGIYDKKMSYTPAAALLSGSEGTLGIVIEIAFELISSPIVSKTSLVYYSSIEEAIDDILNMKKSKISPSVIELVDKSTLSAMLKQQLLPKGTNSILLVELDSHSLPDLEDQMDSLLEILNDGKCLSYYSSNSDIYEDKVWELRRNVATSIAKLAPNNMDIDISVPLTEMATMIKIIKIIATKYKLQIPVYCHAGEGHLHVNIMFNKKNIIQDKQALLAAEEIFKIAVKLGGVISGEQGIGITKKNFLSIQYSKNEISLMKKIKKAFDPKGIINPGKIFNIDIKKNK